MDNETGSLPVISMLEISTTLSLATNNDQSLLLYSYLKAYAPSIVTKQINFKAGRD